MALPPKKTTPDYHALDKHRMAMFILTQKDRPIPSLQDMQNDLAKDDITSIKERITTAKADHKSDLERLYAAHAEDYLDDQRLRRESREEYASAGGASSAAGGQQQPQQPDGPSNGGSNSRLAEWSEKRDPLTSTDHHYRYALSSHLHTTRMTYTSLLHSLDLTHKKLTLQADEDRRKRDAQFPLSIDEFKSKPRDIQIRVATFLNADTGRRERMMNEFGWAWRQTDTLVRLYAVNEEFRAEVLRLVEILESKDPRRKPSMTT